jgi:hypothetical protein
MMELKNGSDARLPGIKNCIDWEFIRNFSLRKAELMFNLN